MERRRREGSHRHARSSVDRDLAVSRAAAWFGALALVGPTGAPAPNRRVSSRSRSKESRRPAATLHGSIDPKGIATTYRFEYLTEAAYEANVAAARGSVRRRQGSPRRGGSGAGRLGTIRRLNPQHTSGLAPDTAYRYRLRAQNAAKVLQCRPALRHRGGDQRLRTARRARLGDGLADRKSRRRGPAARGDRRRRGLPGRGGRRRVHLQLGRLVRGRSPGGAGGQPVRGDPRRGAAGRPRTSPRRSLGQLRRRTRRRPYQLFSGDLARRCSRTANAAAATPAANARSPTRRCRARGRPAGYRDYYLRTPSGGFRIAPHRRRSGPHLARARTVRTASGRGHPRPRPRRALELRRADRGRDRSCRPPVGATPPSRTSTSGPAAPSPDQPARRAKSSAPRASDRRAERGGLGRRRRAST